MLNKKRIVIQCKTKALLYQFLTLSRRLGAQFGGFRDPSLLIFTWPCPMSVPRTLDGFDVTTAVQRMLDQPMLWWQAVGMFVEHFSGWERIWQESIGDDAQERKRVHAVHSAAANVGAVQLAEAAGTLENLLLKRLADPAADVPASSRQQLRDAFQQAWLAASVAWEANRPGGMT
jgi:HPt (histidine-containing phosphotransfer) domain-containing protein